MIRKGNDSAARRLPPKTQILYYLLSFDLFTQLGRPEEGHTYAAFHLQRLLRTLEYLPRFTHTPHVLELGSSPYFMTLLLQKYLKYDITPANFYGDYGGAPPAPEERVTIRSTRYAEDYTFCSKLFNIEQDTFPYVDSTFDMVLCCEILEHLVMDPSHLLYECHRVVKPGGYLFISTPNVASLNNVIKLSRGANIYQPYSGYGVYGRHNREYTAHDVQLLLVQHNWAPLVIIDDAYEHDRLYRCLTSIGRLRRRRDNLFVIGKSQGTPVRRYPEWLFAHHHARRLQLSSTITMRDGDWSQLGAGWFDCEDWPPIIRWTGPAASATMSIPSPTPEHLTFGCKVFAGPADTGVAVIVDGDQIGSASLDAG